MNTDVSISATATSERANLAALQPRHVGRVNWRGMWELYLKECRRFWKVGVQTIAAPVITSAMFLFVMVFAMGAAVPRVGGHTLAEFLVPGLVIMTMIQNAFANTSSSILGAKLQGNIVDVLMPPLSPMELTLGWTLGGVTRGVVVGIVAFAAVGVFASLQVHHAGLILFHAVAGCLFMSCVGVLTAIWADKFDHMAAVTNFLVTPLTFLSGTFYTIDRLPPWAQFMAHYNPFFYNIDGFRYGFLGQQGAANPALGIVVLTVLNLALFGACYLTIRSGYKLKA